MIKSLTLLGSIIGLSATVGMPAPYAFSEDYASYEACELQSEVIKNKTYYKSDIKNTGNRYIDIGGSYLEKENSKNEAITMFSEVIAPNQSKTVYFENDVIDKTFDKNDLKIKAYLEPDRDAAKFNGFGAKTKEFYNVVNYFGEEVELYQYFIEVNYELLVNNDSFYSLMFSVSYNGNEHSYYQYDFNKEKNPYQLRFKTTEVIDDLDSIEVKDVFLLKGNSYYEEYKKKDNKEALKKGLLAGGLALLLIGLIIGVIFLLRKVFSQKHA